MSESSRLSPLYVVCIIVCLSWAYLIITVITLPTKPSATKMPRTEAGERGNYSVQMRQRDVAALDAKYTKELADAKAENDALRDEVLPLVVVGCTSKQSVRSALKPPPPPAWIMQPPPTSGHR